MCTAPRFRPGGLDANKPPRWSAERRASPGAQTVKASLRGDARTYVTGPPLERVPMHPKRLSALRFPHLCEGDWQSSEVVMTRENDDVCPHQ
jgi:hypothetical protein